VARLQATLAARPSVRCIRRNFRGLGVAQVKKSDKREAILAAAFDLFARKGFATTTMAEIARGANTTDANLYVYFPSKLVIMYEIYNPWLAQQLEVLRASVQRLRSPRMRLRRIFIGIWGDIPAADHCFANCLIEALAQVPKRTNKPSDLLLRSEEMLTALIAENLSEERRHLLRDRLFAHVAWMAFDGFAINQRIGDLRDIEAIADIMTDLLLGTEHAHPTPVRETTD
jgi:AcrR family transcriptional regulator